MSSIYLPSPLPSPHYIHQPSFESDPASSYYDLDTSCTSLGPAYAYQSAPIEYINSPSAIYHHQSDLYPSPSLSLSSSSPTSYHPSGYIAYDSSLSMLRSPHPSYDHHHDGMSSSPVYPGEDDGLLSPAISFDQHDHDSAFAHAVEEFSVRQMSEREAAYGRKRSYSEASLSDGYEELEAMYTHSNPPTPKQMTTLPITPDHTPPTHYSHRLYHSEPPVARTLSYRGPLTAHLLTPTASQERLTISPYDNDLHASPDNLASPVRLPSQHDFDPSNVRSAPTTPPTSPHDSTTSFLSSTPPAPRRRGSDPYPCFHSPISPKAVYPAGTLMPPAFIDEIDEFYREPTAGGQRATPLARRHSDQPQSPYTASQAALQAAKEMNRLLARFPVAHFSPQQSATPEFAASHSIPSSPPLLPCPPVRQFLPPPPPRDYSQRSYVQYYARPASREHVRPYSMESARPRSSIDPSRPPMAKAGRVPMTTAPRAGSSSSEESVHPRFRQPLPISSEEKSHQCNVENCGRSFKRLEHLKRHQLTHTAEKNWMCDYPDCGKSFSRSDNLTQHKRTHNRPPKRARV